MEAVVIVEPSTPHVHLDCILYGAPMAPGNADLALRVDGVVLGSVCGRCLEAGEDGLTYRIRQHANNLRELAERLDDLAAEGVRLPTVEEFEAAMESSREGE